MTTNRNSPPMYILCHVAIQFLTYSERFESRQWLLTWMQLFRFKYRHRAPPEVVVPSSVISVVSTRPVYMLLADDPLLVLHREWAAINRALATVQL